MKKLVLIDGNSLINRAYYATPPMSNSKGLPTNAVLAFINMLLKLTNELNPDYLLVAFDRKEPTFRHKMYAEYKGTRKPMPEDLVPQVSTLKEVLDAMGIARYEEPGIEADDIIGTLSKSYKDVFSIIVTGDKDSFQLVSENTSVYFTKRGISDIDVYSSQNFTKKTNLASPSLIIDLKALMGDSSDNIPGIAGVGEKTAKSLLADFGNVDGIYENVESIKGKLKEKILMGEQTCYLSKELATINTNVNIGLALNDMTYSSPFPFAAKKKFAELEFGTLLKKNLFLQEDAKDQTNIETKLSEEESIEQAPQEIIKITAKTNLNDVFLSKAALYFGDDVYIYSNGVEYVIPVSKTFFDEGFSFDAALNLLKPILENENANLILFSSKNTRHMLDEYGLKINAHVEDVSLQKYIADFGGQNEDVNASFLKYSLPENHPAFSLFRLHEILNSALKSNDQYDLYKEIELPLSSVLYDMEKTGFRVDENKIAELSEKYKAQISLLTEQIYQAAGETFNINSPKQLGAILFEKLDLNRGKKKRGGFSTSAEVLEEIADLHEIVPLILQYRKISKLNSTYVDGFIPLIDKKTGLIHTIFNQTLTTTGRLSSKEPNLQNLPIRDEGGREIREFFIPSDENHVLVGADYSQIELRLLAHFSNCEKLIQAYKNDEDIHSITAASVFGIEVENVTSAMRRKAKAVNFGIIYGISEYGLSKNVKCSPKEAKEYITRYFENYPEVKAYMNSNVEFARKNGYVSTLCGRKRYLREINSPNYNLRSFGERAAMNMPLQGSSADIIKIAMLRVYEKLKAENLSAKLILQIHDELIIDTPIEEKPLVEKLLKEEMENAVSLQVPLIAEVYCGKNLAEAK